MEVMMWRMAPTTILCCVTLCAACSGSSANPVAPSGLPSSVGPVPGAGANSADLLPGSHGNKLIAIVGSGNGIVNVSPDANEMGFSVETEVAVWNARPATTFDVKRAVDVNANGICTSTNFVQLPLPNPGPLVKLTTSPGGAGTVHLKFALPQVADGTTLAVRFEVSSEDSTIVLRTECLTVAVK
jgi:hypothetical protein